MGTSEISYYVMPGLKQNEVRFEQVIRKVCDVMKVDRFLILTPKRSKELVFARNMCFFIFRRYFSMTLKEIGQVFERDHTTVIHGITTFENDLQFMKLYKDQFCKVKQDLGLNMANKNLLTLTTN
jgi:chromosomal replication initiation ATPase DnaA